MDRLFLLSGAVARDPAIDAWLSTPPDALRRIARIWFEHMRACGPDMREVMHDGCPTACVGDAAFAYVGVFTAHVNVGFFNGAMLDDAGHLLEGTGKRMRHVKLRPGQEPDEDALKALIAASYRDIKARRGSP